MSNVRVQLNSALRNQAEKELACTSSISSLKPNRNGIFIVKPMC